MTDLPNGYYWAREPTDGTIFVVLWQDNQWFACGVRNPLRGFDRRQIIKRIEEPVN